MDEIYEKAEEICTSWINGQKKQAVKQLLGSDSYNEVVDAVAESESLSAEEKVRFFAYVLMYGV